MVVAAERGVIISADSHVMEPPDLWAARVPASLRDKAPVFPPHRVGEGFQAYSGGWDPHERQKEMATDGVGAEVLYPTLGLSLFGLDDVELHEACCFAFNDWLMEYCGVAPDKLLGIAMIPAYRIDVAVRELERVARGGLRGGLVWQAPHPDLPFTSRHYEPLWDAAQSLHMPINIHILTGHGYSKPMLAQMISGATRHSGIESYRNSVNSKLMEAANALFDMIFSGVLDRFPHLRLVLVENEIGWIPFLLQQWDYYYRRFKSRNPLTIDQEPSFYFNRQVFATFFNDAVGGRLLASWGADSCMWSNDFPHENSTWPKSREVIERHLGHLPDDTLEKLLRGNVRRLYGLESL